MLHTRQRDKQIDQERDRATHEAAYGRAQDEVFKWTSGCRRALREQPDDASNDRYGRTNDGEEVWKWRDVDGGLEHTPMLTDSL
jgi:hypothetical protein